MVDLNSSLPVAAPFDLSGVAADPRAIADLFSQDELRRLIWLRDAVAAERHLVPHGQACPEHLALWLYATRRLSEDDQP